MSLELNKSRSFSIKKRVGSQSVEALNMLNKETFSSMFSNNSEANTSELL